MQTRRMFLGSALAAPLIAKKAAPPKNVLLLMADDMNSRLGCYGHPVVQTPHLDRLARTGVRFDRAYCQYPLCGPSRASAMTGLRPDTSQVLDNNVDFREIHPDAVTLPQLFKQNGWFSARTGKIFHMNVPNEVGLPRFQDEASWSLSLSPQGLENKTPGEGRKLGGSGMNWIAAKAAEGQADTNAADDAIGLLEKHRNQPFFLACGMVRPHLPFVAPAKYFDMYPLGRMDLRNDPLSDLDDVPAAHKGVRPQQWKHAGMNETAQREALRGYYASTSYMDAEMGRVLDALDRLGLAENTAVFFVGDHGWNLGEHTKWQKMCLFEESARVPFIVRAPGAKGNGKPTKALTEMVDIYGTAAEMCGLQSPASYEGQSFMALLEKPERKWKKAAFSQLRFEKKITGRSVRTERYRYTAWEGAEGAGEELYDHQTDPREFTNLAAKPEHARTLAAMRRTLSDGWRAARAT